MAGGLIGPDLGGRVPCSGEITSLAERFVATFFVFFGLQLDTTVMTGVIGGAVALWAVSAALKVATGWWAARAPASDRAELPVQEPR